MATLLLLTLRGTPFLYYGDEIGMQDVDVPEELRRDPWGENVAFLNRDGARTPMQWSADVHAGFTTGDPWLPVAPDYEHRNVEAELDDSDSMLNLYRRIIRLRRESPALRIGSFLAHPSSDENVLVFRKEADHDTKTVALNLSDVFRDVELRSGTVVLSTLESDRSDEVRGHVTLAPREGVVVSHPTG